LGAPGVKAARTLHDLLLLGLYSCVPARGAEVRLLEYIPEEALQKQLRGKVSLKKFVETQQINLITRIDGTWKMILSQYKNVRTHGIDCTDLSQFEWWTKLFEKYIQDYRPKIVSSGSRFVFVTRHGESFTHSYFSDFISSMLFRLSGKKVATNMLRSSFVTHFYNTPESSDPVMRESIASIMRHSVSEAQKTYDRRTSSQKKRKGLDLLAEIANNGNDGNNGNNDGGADLNPRIEKRQNAFQGNNRPKNRQSPHIDATGSSSDTNDSPKVVLFKRTPHKIIRDDGGAGGYLLAKMQRSLTTNAPTYFVPPEAVFELKPSLECTVVDGIWEEDEFTIGGIQK